MERLKSLLYSPATSVLIGLGAGVAYGLTTRAAFGLQELSAVFGTLSAGFLCLTPFALGALTVFFAPAHYRRSWFYAGFMPWLSCALFVTLAAIFTWEAWICLVMAAPILAVMSSVGGVTMTVLFHVFDQSDERGPGIDERGPGIPMPCVNLLLALLFSPYLVTPLERRFPPPDSLHTVHSTLVVNASAETVWRNIIRVPPFAPAEMRESFFHRAGLPRPLEATLECEGVGCTRRGHWEYGLAFDGLITEWQPNVGFTVQLTADTRSIHDARLPLHDIDGPHFGMVDDRYFIEPLGDGRVRLHLYSTYRLATSFNAYGSLWTDFLMRDIQGDILRSIRDRCEASAS